MSFLVYSVIWRNTQTFGADYCTLYTHPSGYDLTGTVITTSGTRSCLIHYEVKCDEEGRTREVAVWLEIGERVRRLHFSVDDEQRWWRDGREIEAFKGLTDVDLGITPATNTLPIRRLKLEPGESREVTAAWVRFPEWKLEPLPQRYTRLDERRYHYESAGFEGVLEVDDASLVILYPDGWERVGTRGEAFER